jgi:hypothetical protein
MLHLGKSTLLNCRNGSSKHLPPEMNVNNGEVELFGAKYLSWLWLSVKQILADQTAHFVDAGDEDVAPPAHDKGIDVAFVRRGYTKEAQMLPVTFNFISFKLAVVSRSVDLRPTQH